MSDSVAPSLDGQRIVVTRAVPQAASLIEAIEAHGGVAIPLPLLEIIDAEDGGTGLGVALSALGAGDWLVVLSPNGARRVLANAPAADRTARPKLAVIASGTQRVFANAGWDADLIPEVPSSVGLLGAFEGTMFDGRVLIAQAENGRVELRNGLAARGVDVDTVTAYRNVMPELDPAMVDAARNADVVVFASPSAVERYAGHVSGTPAQAVCIGGVTAETADNLAFTVKIATAPTVEAIVTALDELKS